MGNHAAVARGLQLVFGAGPVAGLTDEQLLERYVSRRDDDGASFEAIVQRHGPMVWGVCRDILRDPHAAEDAFQATFLVLIQKARSVRVQGSLGRWLYGVAHRVAVRARSDALRRQARERVWTVVEPEQVDAVAASEDHALLHEELRRLPARYRTAIVLCHLEGLTHEEAASRLRWPVGTVRSRLARGRLQLRDRLVRRGMTPAVALAGLARSTRASSALPKELIHVTARAAVALGPNSTGVVSSTALALSKGVLLSMFFAKMKLAAIGMLTASAVVIAGAGVIARQAEKQETTKGEPTAKTDRNNSFPVPFRVLENMTKGEAPAKTDRNNSFPVPFRVLENMTKGEAPAKTVQNPGADDSAPKVLLQGDVRIETKAVDPTKKAAGPVTITGENVRIEAPESKVTSDRMVLSLPGGLSAPGSAEGPLRGSLSGLALRHTDALTASAGELGVRLQAARRHAARVKAQFEKALISRADYEQAEDASAVIEAQISDQVGSLRDQEELLRLRVEACELEVQKAKVTEELQLEALATYDNEKSKGTAKVEGLKKQEGALRVAHTEMQLQEVALREAQLLLKQTTRRREAFEKALAPAAKAEPPANTSEKPAGH